MNPTDEQRNAVAETIRMLVKSGTPEEGIAQIVWNQIALEPTEKAAEQARVILDLTVERARLLEIIRSMEVWRDEWNEAQNKMERIMSVLVPTDENACAIADAIDPQRRIPDLATVTARVLRALCERVEIKP